MEFKEGDRVRFKRREEIGEEVLKNAGIANEFLKNYLGKAGEIFISPGSGAIVAVKIDSSDQVIWLGHSNVLLEKEHCLPEELFYIED